MVALAAAAADGVGAATLAFLTARALEDRRKEEQEHHWYFTGAGMVVWVSTQAFPFFTRVATVVTQAVDDGCRTR